MMLAVSAIASPARAQDAGAEASQAGSSRPIEITPFVALGSPGVSRAGAAISVPLNSTLALEAEIGYRRGEGRMHALTSNASLVYALPRAGRVVPYLAGGAGIRTASGLP